VSVDDQRAGYQNRRSVVDGDTYIGRDDPGEAERLAAQALGGSGELRGALAQCQLPDRPRVLEIGCGSGAFTAELLHELPRARITAVDLNAALLEEARRRLGDAASARGPVRLARADAAALPYAARVFDLVACRCVLMHQVDAQVVAAEMHRVTAPGGWALAIEPDWGARALYPDPGALSELLDLARRARPFGFPEPRMGSKLFAVLRAAGFVPVRVLATAFVETADDVARATGVDQAVEVFGPSRLLEQGRHMLRTAGLTTDDDLDALIERLDAIPRARDYCSAGVDFVAVGEKPYPRPPG
jgi:SAM-dependent methyltransferase